MLPTTRSTKSKRSGRDTSREETKNEGFTFSLAVYGSSAPIYTSPPKTQRQSKTPKQTRTETKRNYSFPVEKIILLAERLELTSLREQQPISYFKTDNRLEENETASGLDFSLDLSSVNAESEESESETLENLHYNSRSSTKRDAEEEKEKKADDLVNSYVNSVDNQELRKYFRTCRTCREPCCVCPKEKLNKAVETETSMTKFKCGNGSLSVNGRKYEPCCRSYCCPDDFFEDYCPECVCRCESGGLADTERMLSYANSLASAARSARVLARDLESVLSSFKSDTD